MVSSALPRKFKKNLRSFLQRVGFNMAALLISAAEKYMMKMNTKANFSRLIFLLILVVFISSLMCFHEVSGKELEKKDDKLKFKPNAKDPAHRQEVNEAEGEFTFTAQHPSQLPCPLIH